jgi:hypothetical protein
MSRARLTVSTLCRSTTCNGGNARRSGARFAPTGRPGRRRSPNRPKRAALIGVNPNCAVWSITDRPLDQIADTNGCTPVARPSAAETRLAARLPPTQPAPDPPACGVGWADGAQARAPRRAPLAGGDLSEGSKNFRRLVGAGARPQTNRKLPSCGSRMRPRPPRPTRRRGKSRSRGGTPHSRSRTELARQ